LSASAETTEKLQCISCGRVLARAVSFCPYCAKPQNPVVEPLPLDGDESADFEAPPIEDKLPPPAPSPLPGPAQGGGTGKSPNTEVQPPRPRSKLWILVIPFLLLAAGAALLLRSGPPAPGSIEVRAVASEWKPVDVNALPAGSTLVVSGDGPFRIRSQSTPPILVDGGGSTDLSSLDRGIEVEAASGGEVRVTFEAAGNDH
jgi:hypothetical protein